MTPASSSRRWSVALSSLISLLPIAPATAQSSASYKLTESSFNNGGDPRGGVSLTSPHFHLSLDTVGESVVRAGLASASFQLDGGFVDGNRPPGEVGNLRFNDMTTFQWNPEAAATKYEIYRGPIPSLPGTFGTCFAGDVPAVIATDASSPATGQAFFYLVTARNRLREEGPKGYRSDGTVEGNPSPCP